MLFYIINLICICVCMYIFRKKKNIMYNLVTVWLILLSGCRGVGVGADYDSYQRYFEIYSRLSWRDVLTYDLEPGYALLNKIVSALWGDYQVLLFICAIFSIIGVVHYIKNNSNHPIFSIWIYITMMSYQSTFTRLRQAIAISFVLFAYEYAKKRDFKKFLLLILVATSFHSTAIFMLIIYPILNKKISMKAFLAICFGVVALIIGGPYYGNLINTFLSFVKYSKYIGTQSGEGEVLLCVYIIITIFVFVSGNYRLKNKEILNENELVIVRLINFSVLTVVIQALALNLSIINRMAGYFSIPMMLLLPNVLDLYKKEDRKIITMVMILLFFVVYLYFLNGGASQTVPYSFFK